ncbi:MAG: AEC family transporter [Burkholderiaceae bacterium]
MRGLVAESGRTALLPIINVTVPFFALVLCGWLAAKAKQLPDQAVAALNGFILYFALPAMLFRFVANASISTVVSPAAFFIYALVGVAVFAISVLGLRWGNSDNWVDTAFGGLAASWPNWGYMGFGLIPALFGPEAIATLISAGLADLLILMPLGLLVASRQNLDQGQNTALASLLGVSRNPLIWAISAGLAASLVNLPIPTAIDEFLRLLGTAAGPVALFSIGVSLYRPQSASAHSDTWILVVTKLVFHPLVMWIVAYHLFSLERQIAAIMTVMAALPAAGTAFLFTERHGGDVDRVAGLIMITTALAFVSFTVTVALLGVKG